MTPLASQLQECDRIVSQKLTSELLTCPLFPQGTRLSKNGGVILRRADRPDLNSLAALRHMSISAFSPDSLFAYQAQLNEFLSQGIELSLHVDQIVFTSSIDAIILDVYDGETDAGFVGAGELEDAVARGLLPAGALVPVYREETRATSGFPFEISTLLYPNTPLVMHSKVDFDVQRLVAEALLGLNSSSLVVKKGHYTGWRPAASYLEVLNAALASGLYDADSNTCMHGSNPHDIIACPVHYRLKSEEGLVASCADEGRTCPPDYNGTVHDCVCHPCTPVCGKLETETSPGVCECATGYIAIAGICVQSYAVAVAIVLPVLILVIFAVRWLLKWQQRRSDQLWHIKPHELDFDEPVVCLGKGSFGIVVKAEYRGSKVALKAMLPRSRKAMWAALGSVAASAGDDGSKRVAAVSATQTAAVRKGALSPLITGYGYTVDEKQRGVEKLHRALRNAVRSADNSEAANDTEHKPGRTQDVVSSSKAHGTNMEGGSRSRSRTRTLLSNTGRWLSRRLSTRERQKRVEFTLEMRLLSKLRHPCVATVIGAVLEPNCPPVLVMEYMDLGSLHSLLHNTNIAVDDETMRMMMLDIVHGCRFLHAANPAVVHGDLKAMVSEERVMSRQKHGFACFCSASHTSSVLFLILLFPFSPPPTPQIPERSC